MADTESWAKQPPSQRDERERRLESVKRTAKAFLDLGKACLAALIQLTAGETSGAPTARATPLARALPPPAPSSLWSCPRLLLARVLGRGALTQSVPPLGAAQTATCALPSSGRPTASTKWRKCSCSSSGGCAAPSAR
eukprot:64887-Prymnesium_polylepis.2